MGALDIPDNGGLRFNFEVSSDRLDMSWSQGSLGAVSSLTYITESMTSAAQTQVIVDITNGDQELSALNGIYIKQRDGTFGKVYTYYFRSGENPCMTFVDGYWQLCSRPRAGWCFRRHGESGAPPGGEWELAPRLMKPRSTLDNCPATSCRVRVTKAVGCGKPITWSRMAQADPEVVKGLGLVDALEKTGCALEAVGMELREELLERRPASSEGIFTDFSGTDPENCCVFEI